MYKGMTYKNDDTMVVFDHISKDRIVTILVIAQDYISKETITEKEWKEVQNDKEYTLIL